MLECENRRRLPSTDSLLNFIRAGYFLIVSDEPNNMRDL